MQKLKGNQPPELDGVLPVIANRRKPLKQPLARDLFAQKHRRVDNHQPLNHRRQRRQAEKAGKTPSPAWAPVPAGVLIPEIISLF